MFRHLKSNRKLSFLVVGGAAFVADALSFWLFFSISNIDVHLARVLAFCVAVMVTWYGNRSFTFSTRKKLPAKQQIVRAFIGACCSLIPNLAVFTLLAPFFIEAPFIYIPFCAGIIAGTVSNFILSDKFIYREKQT